MADYWKSQPRHFCEFCKCWTADNKPSREFHERGKRHQENVKQKLDTLRKKSVEDARKEKETASYLVRMEKEALKKCKEDLAANPSLASQYGVTVKSKAAEAEAASSVALKGEVLPAADTSAVSQWNEALSPEGYVYYWNAVTQESRWELPLELIPNSIKPEPAQNPPSTKNPSGKQPSKPSTSVGKQPSLQVIPTVKNLPTDETSVVKTKSTEGQQPDQQKKKQKKAKQDQGPLVPKIEGVVVKEEGGEKPVGGGMAPRFRPAYGAWEEVKQVEAPFIDYQLPVSRDQPDIKPSLPPAFTPAVIHERKHQFGERTVTSLATEGGQGEGSGEGFKKRKLNSGMQRGKNGRLGGGGDEEDK